MRTERQFTKEAGNLLVLIYLSIFVISYLLAFGI